jgi:hypothetical protein
MFEVHEANMRANSESDVNQISVYRSRFEVAGVGTDESISSHTELNQD